MKKQDELSVRICGIGGQGIVLAGNILAEALLRNHRYATNSASYGPEVRGTSVRSDVLAAQDWIAYPRAERPDFVIALGQKVYNAGVAEFDKETVVIYDPVLVRPAPKCPARHIAVKASQACLEKFGDNADVNLVMLGALSSLGVAQTQDLEAAAVERIRARDDARRAIALGRELAAQN
jgi:2-oxoglutarate ferredoxin oxidoreductase subunit gamma